MRNLVIWMLLLLAWPAAAEQRPVDKFFFQPLLGDMQSELAPARAAGKKAIMVFFEMDDCPFCERMKTTILNQSDVQDYYRKHFAIFTIDTQGDLPLTDFSGKQTREKDFALTHRVRATPVIAFFDLDGKPITRFTGATRDKQEFLLLGRYVAEGAYARQPFNVYKQAATPAP
jgi:thioredoxin-related protein